jgi:hypothetical protein
MMPAMLEYRAIIKHVLLPYTRIPYAYGDLQCEGVFDDQQGRYVLMTLGWERGRRVHSCLVHIDVTDDYVWIQRDGTEHGVALELVKAGVPKDRIVLAFHPPDRRQYTDFAHTRHEIR